MKVLTVSDLHCEFHRDGGEALASSLPDADVIVLAGDITLVNPKQIGSLDHFTDRYPHVVFVAGNHEYYGSSVQEVHDRLADYAAQHPTFHWLNKSAVTINGQRFIGGTLWFPHNVQVDIHKRWLTDFRVIEGFSPWVFDECEATKRYLKENVRKEDIVVTHHLPSPRCIHPRYEGSPYNVFFLCDVEDIIDSNRPRLWIHGHTHDSLDREVRETRVICNPFGYARFAENTKFDPLKLIAIE